MADTPIFWDDDDFMDSLVTLLCTDSSTLRKCGHLFAPDDFKPLRGMRWGRPRWNVASAAIEYWRRFHEPVGRMLRSEVLSYVGKTLGQGERQLQETRDYLGHLRSIKVVGPDAVIEKAAGYKRERLKAMAVQEMGRLQAMGELTDQKWREITEQTLVTMDSSLDTVSYYDDLESRLARRRSKSTRQRTPMFFIDPLDILVRGIGPGQLGMILAPYNRGKGLMLLWLSVAYTLQQLNVLLVTLEDTRPEVEDRLDAIIAKMPIDKLANYPKTLTNRFGRFRRLVRSKLHIYDGTEGGISVSTIEQIYLKERERGFTADAIVVDYDDEIQPAVKNKERRMDFSEIYRDLRQLAGRRQLLVWTAAQTQRGTEAMKVLSGDKAAEDISKLRKVTMCLSLGQGDWTSDSIYLWVAKHRFDTKHVGCHVLPDLKRTLIYDREKTLEYMRDHRDDG